METPASEWDLTGIKVAVCVATFRRPGLLRGALESIAEQRFEGGKPPTLAVLVADNDPDGAGLAVVEDMRAGFPWPLRGMHEPTRGISFARNALVSAAAGNDYIAFIDDDETAAPDWLQQLLTVAVATRAEAVVGPVRVRFEAPPPAWLQPDFESLGLEDGAPVPGGAFRTGNVLLKLSALAEIEGPFDPAFALTGGSDYMLGQALLARGAKLAWAGKAVVSETVPATRTTFRWYIQRRFRTGMTFSMAQKRVQGALKGSLKGAYRGAGSITAGSLRLMRDAPRGRVPLARAAGLIAYGVGNLAGVTGGHYEEYRTVHGR